jgi:hypothetical protein
VVEVVSTWGNRKAISGGMGTDDRILFHFYWVVGANTKVGQEDMSEHRGVIYQ